MAILIDALIFVGGGVLLALAGLFLVRWKFKRYEFRRHQDVAGYFLAVIGTLYSIVLGLIVVNIQTKFDQARLMAEEESNSCWNIRNLTRGLPLEVRTSIRKPLHEFYISVKNEDWEDISKGTAREASGVPHQALWQAVSSYHPNNNFEAATYSSMLDSLKNLDDARRFRMVAKRRTVTPVVWSVLIVGAIFVIGFTYYFWVESLFVHIALTSFVAFFLSLVLFLVHIYSNPYRHELMLKESVFNNTSKDDNNSSKDDSDSTKAGGTNDSSTESDTSEQSSARPHKRSKRPGQDSDTQIGNKQPAPSGAATHNNSPATQKSP